MKSLRKGPGGFRGGRCGRRMVGATVVGLGLACDASAVQGQAQGTMSGSGASPSAKELLARCTPVKSEIARLACFDSLAAGLITIAPSASSGAGQAAALGTQGAKLVAGHWVVNEAKNPLDDSPTVTLLNFSESGKSRFGSEIALVIRCQRGDLNIYVNWGSYLGDNALVTSRIGTAPADARGWSLSTDKRATFVPGKARDWFQKLEAADRFVAQVTPYSDSPVTAEWATDGLEEAAKALKTACGLL